ncbi:hypothetical protein ERJ75_000710100 [Trypanosoma vivax]|uniref:Uncharacterized protein n=1 Tax=Trypanosoma vivax (strain Y486) TaxID=1055687 RepID=G0TTX5_TRYVY|nr:hypothetical protein TRVL_02094 [Trypanosoma vivax]KAH8613699.1 hypothetical protein ERJ75_000710100 [Trypanosoma vivax]CCC47408.1 conserved hypothetical protein [Trypanosoma vivax Y486]
MTLPPSITLDGVVLGPLETRNVGPSAPSHQMWPSDYNLVGEALPDGRIQWFLSPFEGYQHKRLAIEESVIKECLRNHPVYIHGVGKHFQLYGPKNVLPSFSGISMGEAARRAPTTCPSTPSLPELRTPMKSCTPRPAALARTPLTGVSKLCYSNGGDSLTPRSTVPAFPRLPQRMVEKSSLVSKLGAKTKC